jgi:hypothetical protein
MAKVAPGAASESAGRDTAFKSFRLTKGERVKLKGFVGKSNLDRAAATSSTSLHANDRSTPELLMEARRLVVAHIVLRAGAGEAAGQIAAAIRAAGLPCTENVVRHTVRNWELLRDTAMDFGDRLDRAGSDEDVVVDPEFKLEFESPELGELMRPIWLHRTSQFCSKTASAKPDDSESGERTTRGSDYELTATDRKLLRILAKHRAFDETCRVKAGVIAADPSESIGNPDSKHVQNSKAKLRAIALIKSKCGPSGGYWLTPEGRSAAADG